MLVLLDVFCVKMLRLQTIISPDMCIQCIEVIQLWLPNGSTRLTLENKKAVRNWKNHWREQPLEAHFSLLKVLKETLLSNDLK